MYVKNCEGVEKIKNNILNSLRGRGMKYCNNVFENFVNNSRDDFLEDNNNLTKQINYKNKMSKKRLLPLTMLDASVDKLQFNCNTFYTNKTNQDFKT